MMTARIESSCGLNFASPRAFEKNVLTLSVDSISQNLLDVKFFLRKNSFGQSVFARSPTEG